MAGKPIRASEAAKARGDGLGLKVVREHGRPISEPSPDACSRRRERCVEDVVAINPNGANPEPVRDLLGAAGILAHHAGCEPIDGVVRLRD